MFKQRLSFPIVIVGCLLSSTTLTGASASTDLALGIAQFETVAVSASGGVNHRQNIVIRVTSEKNMVQSFGVSNEAGLASMPLPPGKYAFDAFSATGRALQMARPASERWFEVKKDQDIEVGVGFKE